MTAPFDYILSGPITGTTDYIERFAVAYCRVRQAHFARTGKLPNVWNPAELDKGRTNEWYMRRCHEAIFDSHDCALVQMAGWQESKGSRSEFALCESLDRVVLSVDSFRTS